MSEHDPEDTAWMPPQEWMPCEDRVDPASWDDPDIVDEPYND